MTQRIMRWSAAAGLLISGVASASDGPAEPEVDFSDLAPSASVRPDNLNGEPHEAHARLVTDSAALVPGQTVRVGVHLAPDDGWHAYWKAPGETGEPLRIEWDLPHGMVAPEHAFPVPVRFDQSGIISFGYEGNVLLFSDVEVPSDVPMGMTELKAHASWLVCEDMCIKGEVDLVLPIAVAAEAQPTPWAPLFDFYAAQHPTPLAAVDAAAVESALSRSAVRPGETVQAVFRLVGTTDSPIQAEAEDGKGGWPVFTPIADVNSMWVEPPVVTTADDGSTLVVLTAEAYELDELPENTTIGGLFQFEVDGERVATEVAVPLNWVAADAETQASTSPLFAMAGVGPDGDAGGTAEPAAGVAQQAEPVTAGGRQASLTESFQAWFITLPSWMKTLIMLAAAFLGGMILNVMPCVLPVLALKLFGLVHHSGASAGIQRRAGIAYTAGVLVSFFALAVGIVVLQSVTGAAGWGVQFQSPVYVVALCTVVFLFGLSMFGVFEVPAIGSNVASSATARDGVGGDFMYGVFATLLATPCSAPLLAPAVTYAFSMPSAYVFVFFLTIGAGLAFPFLIIAFIPALFRLLPRPGAWMETFKQAMGFALVGAAVWVAYPLPALIGSKNFVLFLAFLTVVGAAAWLFGRFAGVAESGQRQAAVGGVALLMMGVGGFFFLDLSYTDEMVCDDNSLQTDLAFTDDIPWQPFTEDRLAAASNDGPVFIDFTADWCVTCKVNERVVIDTEPVRQAMADCGIIPLKADWTRRDEVITDWLARYGRAGVPFYLFVPSDGGDAVPLPDLLTSTALLETFAQGC